MRHQISFLFHCFCVFTTRMASAIVVDIPGLGQVEGMSSTTAWTNRTVFEFRGVRYAQSPSGARRFKEPVKESAWAVVFDATKYGQSCPQPGPLLMHSRNSFIPGDTGNMRSQSPIDYEDCLFLDVYTPNATTSAKLPVLVYFHGGYFISGSSSGLRPGFLLESDMILVCPQYRLGVLGFYSLNTVDAPGNVGLADQIMALQWVKDNIAAFGGDPTRVTIAGSSAGAASVSLHMISDRAKGLFQQVVAQSGSALAPWAVDQTGGAQHSRAVADLLGCSSATQITNLANCMRNQTVFTIIHAALTYSMMDWRAGRSGWGACQPTIQRVAPGVTPIIPSTPETLFQAAKYVAVPLMMAFTKHEGIFPLDAVYQYFLQPNNLVRDLRFLREALISTLLNIYGVPAINNFVLSEISKRYFNTSDFTNFMKIIPALVDLSGAMMIKGPSVRQAELHSKRANNNTYFYTFDYKGEHTLFNRDSFSLPVSEGITHGDDTIYLFPNPDFPLNANDTLVAKQMTTLFSNFVINGNPSLANIECPLFESVKRSYISVDSTTVPRSNLTTTFNVAKSEGLSTLNL